MEVDCLAGKAGKAPKSLAELCCEVLFALEFLFRKDGPGKEQRPEQSGAERSRAEQRVSGQRRSAFCWALRE